MSLVKGGLVTVGLLLLVAGVILIMYASGYAPVFGAALCGLALCVFIGTIFNMMKSSRNMAVPGHFLLHPRTGTRYTYEQAIALQRRLDRIRRASAQERSSVQRPPLTHADLHSLPSTPPPWDMEPPPSYETVMKTSASLNQL